MLVICRYSRVSAAVNLKIAVRGKHSNARILVQLVNKINLLFFLTSLCLFLFSFSYFCLCEIMIAFAVKTQKAVLFYEAFINS